MVFLFFSCLLPTAATDSVSIRNSKILSLEKDVRLANLSNFFSTRSVKRDRVFLWHLVKSHLSSTCNSTQVHWTIKFVQGTENTRPCITGDPVPLVGLHVRQVLVVGAEGQALLGSMV